MKNKHKGKKWKIVVKIDKALICVSDFNEKRSIYNKRRKKILLRGSKNQKEVFLKDL